MYDVQTVLYNQYRKYSVMVGYKTVAENMDIKTTLILVGALMDEYYEEPNIQISIVRECKEGEQDASVNR